MMFREYDRRACASTFVEGRGGVRMGAFDVNKRHTLRTGKPADQLEVIIR